MNLSTLTLFLGYYVIPTHYVAHPSYLEDFLIIESEDDVRDQTLINITIDCSYGDVLG